MYNLVIHLFGGHLGYFHFLVIKNDAAVKILCMSLCAPVQDFPQRTCIEVEFLGYNGGQLQLHYVLANSYQGANYYS